MVVLSFFFLLECDIPGDDEEDREKVEQAINDYLKLTKTNIEIEIDRETNQPIIKIVRSEDKEVIKEVGISHIFINEDMPMIGVDEDGEKKKFPGEFMEMISDYCNNICLPFKSQQAFGNKIE